MRTPTHVTAIAAIGSSEQEVGQALALLRAAGCAEPEALTLGEGDRLLLALHRALAGADVEIALECVTCDAVSVATLSTQTVPPCAPRWAWLAPGAGLRQPTYADLEGLAGDAALAAAQLLERCTIGAPPDPARPEHLDLIDEALTGPLVTACVECGQPLETPADVERLVLEGIQRCAMTLELELHLLASAYGWSLAEIESLTDDRRHRLARLVADGR